MGCIGVEKLLNLPILTPGFSCATLTKKYEVVLDSKCAFNAQVGCEEIGCKNRKCQTLKLSKMTIKGQHICSVALTKRLVDF